jgi:MOSC domain-containing protein YiiM
MSAETKTLIRVLAVNVGTPELLMERRGQPVQSGIRKHRLPDGPIVVRETNIEGDGQADLVNHGGPDKAVYVYPSEHLPLWKAEVGYDGGDSPFGENLTISGMLEDEARIGDIWQWGEVRMQVSQPRWPCFKLAHRSGHPDMIKRLVASNRSGWYMRVLQPGTTSVEAPIELIEIDPAGITVRQAFRANINRTSLDDVERARIVSHPALSEAWRAALRQ